MERPVYFGTLIFAVQALFVPLARTCVPMTLNNLQKSLGVFSCEEAVRLVKGDVSSAGQ